MATETIPSGGRPSSRRHIARDLSYAHSAASKGGRALIRVMENVTGRPTLIRRADGYDREVAAGRDFWSVMLERYMLSLEVVGGSLDNIPDKGPLILIANHPYGVLDGLMMGHILHQRRGDFRILANRVFRKSEDLNRVILPISFDETRAAQQENIQTRKECIRYLSEGGAIGIFPGGTVSTGLKPFSQPMDPGWRGFTARMIAKSDATVVPVFFAGRTSRLFQLASHLHSNLRMGLLLKEFRARIGTPVQIAVGAPIPRSTLDQFSGDTKGMMDFLRKATYDLSPEPLKNYGYGFEFEQKHRS
ncbi:lysophospholipid acyltransferase family protein [Pseudooceanicola aestuarii]|uniref:lysophospholipid acyltransferase family protein n=1 Tax=Pseudooceanicola aestuarii TaxID=2697319 RepID=UPI0013D1B69A|nr:lysophospholipid acyltransferase family protein [Pseudooceanicola aestuarii]